MTDLAIIIVNWNVRALLANCLLTVQADLARSRLAAQVWVVDNGSTDGSVAMLRRHFPWVRLIASQSNLGFAGGNNAALQAIGFGDSRSLENTSLPETVLLLNPDTLIHPGALAALHQFLRLTPQAGIAGARLLYADGAFQHGAFGFPGLWQLAIELLPRPGRLVESRLNGRYPRSLYNNRQPFLIGHPLGAAMAVRREAIQQAGLLDEQYHMYVEEVDWSWRIRAAGWPAYCVPTALVTHYGGQSTGQLQSRSFISLWQSRYLFYAKHYHPLKLGLARLIVWWGMRRRAAADSQSGQFTAAELQARRSSYQQVIHIWQGKSP